MLHTLFENAIQLHQAGHLQQAETLYRQILAQDPAHAGSLHYLGLIALQTGQGDTAVELISRSASLDPNSPEVHSNLGNALRSQGRLDDAIAAFRSALELKPDFPEACYNLGTALLDRREFDQAAAAFRRAISLRFNYPEAHNNLGTALKELGQLDPAIAAFKQAIALKPHYARAFNNLGIALQANQEPDDARAAFQQAITLKPDFADAFLHLGNIHMEAGRSADAIAAFRQAIAFKHDLPQAHIHWGNLLREAGNLDEAIAHYKTAAELSPTDPIAHFNLATALSDQEHYAAALDAFRRALAFKPDAAYLHEALGATLLLANDIAGAEASFRQAVALEPGSARLWNALGMALNCLGQFNEATDCFRHALKISPDARFYRGLAASGRRVAGNMEIDVLNRLVLETTLPLDDRITAEFVLGKILDEESRYDDAFRHLANANRLFKQSRAAAGLHFDEAALRSSVDRQIATFTPDFFAARRSWGNPSEAPVFIVGMPRSGTSLVEQIAATHPATYGAGELPTLDHLPITRAAPESWTPASIATAADSYLHHIRSLAGPGPQRITDKMPHNIFHLGLIAVLFPNARVIFCHRDPRDNCLSCFFQQFDDNNILFSYDLADCAHQYLQTRRLAAHWRKTLPLQTLEVQYETLVASQEAESRRLITFLGLPWENACLNFHRTRRPVMTASFWQVRQPMYTRSVDRWKHYQHHLAPLLDTLGSNL